jgi:Reverse transcriptase (RNA-dependent DNA polymerase)
LYKGHQVRVLWNGITSSSFRVSNGVIQGGILSPMLFCIYLDVLLLALKHAGVGCHLGKWFIGALAYADDIVLLAPTARAMRLVLKICDDFATKYGLKFNAM